MLKVHGVIIDVFDIFKLDAWNQSEFVVESVFDDHPLDFLRDKTISGGIISLF